jgi:hypothetical protein
MQFLCTVEFEEFLLAWMCAVLEHSSFHHLFQKKIFIFIRVWIRLALAFPSDSEQMLRKYLPSHCIMLEDNQNKT